MSKPPKLSLASIVAEGAPGIANKPGADVVPFPPASGGTGAQPRGTLKERANPPPASLEPAGHYQLRVTAYTERRKNHQLMLEGRDLLFKNRGARSIQQLT